MGVSGEMGMAGPPPLEDMSESLVAVQKRREQKQTEHDRHMAYVKMMKAAHEQPAGTAEGSKLLSCARETKERAEESVEIRANGTCGMKKGFLDAAPKKRSAKNRTAKEDDIEVIRPKEKPKPKGHIEGFEMPTVDVTANQIGDVLEMGQASTNEWMTPELLQAFVREPDLLVAMQDPKMQAMIAEVGKDPTAIEKYKDDKRLFKFYQTYIRLASSFFQKQRE